jgi:hypothetical protein
MSQDYVIHATVNYVVKSIETGETEHGTRRPTIRVRASSEQAAIDIARKRQKEQIGTDWWPVVHLSLAAELVHTVAA